MLVTRISILLAMVFTAFWAEAGSFWIQLNPRNISSQPLAFKVKTERNPKGGVVFYVYIESKEAMLSRNLVASLVVTSGRKQIVCVDLEKKKCDEGVRFVFEVAPKYLAQSKFQFKDVEGSQSPYMGEVYWFFLKDFASEL